MPAYEIFAVDDGEVKGLATTDTATEAIAKMAGAAESHRRVWVKDERGVDVSPDELMARALKERPND